MEFVKMQGAGNDFVVVDARAEDRDWSALARRVCDRHYGVGADGLLLVAASDRADLRMRMFNPDGSEAETCGNGIRCFAKYVIEAGMARAQGGRLTVETLAGVQRLDARVEDGAVRAVRASMGRPVLAPGAIPVAVEGPGPVVDHPVEAAGRQWALTCLSMGNPHAVAFLDTPVADLPLAEIGPEVEHHPLFPRRVNFEVVNVDSRTHLTARVWERGAGLTLACGSGACAVGVAARLKGLVDPVVEVALPGGTLRVAWSGEGEVFLEGPAETVFRGTWPG